MIPICWLLSENFESISGSLREFSRRDAQSSYDSRQMTNTYVKLCDWIRRHKKNIARCKNEDELDNLLSELKIIEEEREILICRQAHARLYWEKDNIILPLNTCSIYFITFFRSGN